MSDAPYYKPYEEGPIFPDDGEELAEEAATFLRTTDRDTEAEVARQNISDKSEASFKEWCRGQVRDICESMGIEPPQF